jgi:ubiquitin carboxyl-terminal hydrolase L5
MSGGDDWCTIESDPGVFTELLEELGCKSVQLEELWTLDDDSLQALEASGKIHGLIFLFQWQQGAAMAKKATALAEDDTPDGLFFAHQVTTNACATQAILSVVLNATDVDLGPTLSEFKDFTVAFSPSLKGVAISSSEPIKKAHNAFGRTDAFLNDGKYVSDSRKSEDVFHFVAYVPQNGMVYELDGLQTGPIVVGEAGDSWLAVARSAIQERMAGEAIKFNLMAVIQDKRIRLRNEADNDPGAAVQLELEESKRAQWKLENQRRRHNYVPLCVAMLKELARMGKLPELVEQAKKRKRKNINA